MNQGITCTWTSWGANIFSLSNGTFGSIARVPFHSLNSSHKSTSRKVNVHAAGKASAAMKDNRDGNTTEQTDVDMNARDSIRESRECR
jgi:hypothetical protein